MKAANYLIIESLKPYNNEIKLNNGQEITVNTTIESVEHINRIGTVVSAPLNTILKKGDEVIVHHNIMRLRNGVGGNKIQSDFYLGDNRYYVPLREVFMYKRGNGTWEALNPYCFIKPIKKEVKEKQGSIYIPENIKSDSHKGMEKNLGYVYYDNIDLRDQGINKGDKIIFSNDSEYEFKIDGDIYYKMRTDNILAKVE